MLVGNLPTNPPRDVLTGAKYATNVLVPKKMIIIKIEIEK